MISVEHISKMHNEEDNKLAQNASSYRPICDIMALELSADDWRKELIDYLKNPSHKVSRQLRFCAAKFVLLENDLYYRTIDGVLLKCLGVEESKSLMDEIRKGVCGAHQLAFKMKWMIRRNEYF
jgi:hypothetical protein